MEEINKGTDFPKSVVDYLSPDWKGQIFKQSTGVFGQRPLMQTNLLWAFLSYGKLVEILLGKVYILIGPSCFQTANLLPHSKNVESILR